MKTDERTKQFSDGERLGALTQIYLELSLPLQVAIWAAAADLRHLNAQKSDLGARNPLMTADPMLVAMK
jgi:hypothetical protein